jgi:hypothetical protein
MATQLKSGAQSASLKIISRGNLVWHSSEIFEYIIIYTGWLSDLVDVDSRFLNAKVKVKIESFDYLYHSEWWSNQNQYLTKFICLYWHSIKELNEKHYIKYTYQYYMSQTVKIYTARKLLIFFRWSWIRHLRHFENSLEGADLFL